VAIVQPVGPTHIFHHLQGMLHKPGVFMPNSSITGVGGELENSLGGGGGSINLTLYLESDVLMQLILCVKKKGHCSGVTSWLRWLKSVLELQPLLQTVFWSQQISVLRIIRSQITLALRVT
jgi:hypothetical protein